MRYARSQLAARYSFVYAFWPTLIASVPRPAGVAGERSAGQVDGATAFKGVVNVTDMQTLPPPQAAAKLNQEGKFDEALALVRPMVEKNEKRPNAFIQMSRALRGLKEDGWAREVEKRAIEVFPDDSNILIHVAATLNGDKEFPAAARLVAGPIEAGRTEPGLFIQLSIALRALKWVEEADAAELRAIELHPANPQLLMRRASMLNDAGRFAETASLLQGKDAVVQSAPQLKVQLDRAEKALASAPPKPPAPVQPAPVQPAPVAMKPAEASPAPAGGAKASPVTERQKAASVAERRPVAAAMAAPRPPVPPVDARRERETEQRSGILGIFLIGLGVFLVAVAAASASYYLL